MGRVQRRWRLMIELCAAAMVEMRRNVIAPYGLTASIQRIGPMERVQRRWRLMIEVRAAAMVEMRRNVIAPYGLIVVDDPTTGGGKATRRVQ